MSLALTRGLLAALALVSTVTFAAGCGEEVDRTQVMVIIRVEAEVRARAESLTVVISSAAPGEAREEIRRLLYTGPSLAEGFPLAWPVSIALVPRGGDTARNFEVVATATDADGMLVAEARVVSGYLAKETLTLDVWLRDACLDVACGEGQTCNAGACEDVTPTDPCELERYDAGGSACGEADAGADGGVDGSMDGGVDAAVDAGVDAAVDGGVDAGADGGVDGSMDSAVDVGVDGGADPLDLYNVVFVSSETYGVGTLGRAAAGAVPAADQHCQDLTMAAGLANQDSTEFRALLPHDGEPVSDWMSGQRGWIGLDGLPFAMSSSDLAAGKVLYPVRLDETGLLVPAARVATGLNSNLTTGILHCGFWTSTSSITTGGDPRSGTGIWLGMGGNMSCAADTPIYCFGLGSMHQVPAPEVPPGAKLAFLSSPIGGAPGSATAMDAHCQSEAPDSGSYRALISEGTLGPADRVTDPGPWFRADGVEVGGRGELTSNRFIAPISVSADGFSYSNADVWTGAMGSFAVSPNCGNWAGGTNAYGQAAGDSEPFASRIVTGCALTARLFCLQTD